MVQHPVTDQTAPRNLRADQRGGRGPYAFWLEAKTKRALKRGLMNMGLTAGSLLGTIAGLIGRGGGSFVVPLQYIAGLDPKVAAATSALTVSSSGLSSFISPLVAAAQPQWGIWLGTVVAVVLGSQLGSWLMAERMKPRVIKKVFSLVL